VQDTLAAINGRTIHTFHTEGAGGGHAPDMLAMAGMDNVLPSSTNPTRPYSHNTTAESLGMIVMAHHLKHSNPEDIAMAQSRIRAETMAAEDVLHDIGALSIYSSDALAMGRIGETFTRLIQTAHKMKAVRGPLPEDAPGNDNFRLMRYLAKMTLNPAIAQGVEHTVGSLKPGRMADLVLWPVRWFGVKPTTVIKGGLMNYGMHGDPNASIPPPEPVKMRPMFGAHGLAAPRTSALFLSQAACDKGVAEELGLSKLALAVRNTRRLSKKDMVLNDAAPQVEVDPDTYEVRVDGEVATAPAVKDLPLTQRYFIV
jgi:urease subunit alpha